MYVTTVKLHGSCSLVLVSPVPISGQTAHFDFWLNFLEPAEPFRLEKVKIADSNTESQFQNFIKSLSASPFIIKVSFIFSEKHFWLDD